MSDYTINRFTILGNIGADAELRKTSAGHAVLTVRVATTTKRLNRQGNRVQSVCWHTITIWGRRAEALAGKVRRGQGCFCEGEIRTRRAGSDDAPIWVTDLIAETFILSPARGKQGTGQETEHRREPARGKQETGKQETANQPSGKKLRSARLLERIAVAANAHRVPVDAGALPDLERMVSRKLPAPTQTETRAKKRVYLDAATAAIKAGDQDQAKRFVELAKGVERAEGTRR